MDAQVVRHRLLDRFARQYCPLVRHFLAGYQSLMQVEYATDVIFLRQADFQPLYEALTHTVELPRFGGG